MGIDRRKPILLVLTPYPPGLKYGHAADEIAEPYYKALTYHFEVHVAGPVPLSGEKARDLAFAVHSLGEVESPPVTSLFSRTPRGVQLSWGKRQSNAALEIVANLRPDFLHIEYIQPASINGLSHMSHTMTIHDHSADLFREKIRTARGLEKLYRLSEYWKMKRLEDQAIASARHVFTLSAKDALGVHDVARSVSFLDLGVHQCDERWSYSESRKPRFCFSGALGREPNERSLDWLVREVMPHVWQQRPDAMLDVVGSSPGKIVRALVDSDPRIHLHADVPEISPYYLQATAVLAPSVLPAGVLVKALSAMAMGVPVVLNDQSREPFHIAYSLCSAADPREYANLMIRLSGEGEYARGASDVGLRLVEEKHTWRRYASRVAEGIRGFHE